MAQPRERARGRPLRSASGRRSPPAPARRPRRRRRGRRPPRSPSRGGPRGRASVWRTCRAGPASSGARRLADAGSTSSAGPRASASVPSVVVLGVVVLERGVPDASGSSPPRAAGRSGRRRRAPARISPSRSSRATSSHPAEHRVADHHAGTPAPAGEIGRGGGGGLVRRDGARRTCVGVGERLPLVEQRGVGLAHGLPQPLDERPRAPGVRCASGTVCRSVR